MRRILGLVPSWLLVVTLLLALPAIILASAGVGPHPHTGVVPPFTAGDPGVKLDKGAEKLLSQDKPYQTQIQSSSSAGRGVVVQDVRAPTDIVWDRILDFNSYNKMVPKTMESSIYKREKAGRGGAERIWVRMKVGFTPAPRLTFFVNHLYQPQLHSMTWTLDYTRKSDFDDSCGYWYVVPHPENEEWTRVYYSVQVSMYSWVPKFVVDFMSKQALTDATGWVKKQSELNYTAKGTSSAKAASTKRRGPLARLFGRKVAPEPVDEEECTAGSDLGKPSPATVTRLILASTAAALVGANIYLFVSQ